MVAARDRKRLAEIGGVVTRFGLGALGARLGLPGTDGATAPTPERVRQAIEELGPTFVKLGQILATRSDLLEPEWIAELEKLHSTAPTLDFETLRGDVESALGGPPETIFARFDSKPLAAASIAQVHRATTDDGREIVLKLRRPGIRALMEADLRLIAQFAKVAEANPVVQRYRPREMVRLLAEAVLEELDFTNEALNAERFAANFRDRPGITIPAIHWQWTREDLLAMDFVEGVPPTDAARLEAAGISPRAVAALGADTVLDMVLIDGLFHGDPHPGNLLCQPGDRIAMLDFGMVGHVSPRRREEMMGFVQSLSGGDPARLADVLAAWTEGTGADRAMLADAANRLVQRHSQGPLVLARVVEDMMALIRDRGLILPADLILIFKAMITIDGVMQRIDPSFDLSAATQRAWGRVMTARYNPDAVRDRIAALLLDLSTTSDNLPRLIRAATAKLTEPAPAQGDGAAATRELTRAVRWLSAAVLAGAAMISAVHLLA